MVPMETNGWGLSIADPVVSKLDFTIPFDYSNQATECNVERDIDFCKLRSLKLSWPVSDIAFTSKMLGSMASTV